MTKPLSKKSLRDLNYIMSDEDFIGTFLIEGERAMRMKINNDGSMTLGKWKYDWLNRILRDVVEISFNDVVIRFLKIITSRNPNDLVLNQGFATTAINSILSGNSPDDIVELLLLNYLLKYRQLLPANSDVESSIRRQPLISQIGIKIPVKDGSSVFLEVPKEKLENNLYYR